MKELLWQALAKIVSHPPIARAIISRAQRTPYEHIRTRDGTQMYMRRWWLFNPYGKDAQGHPTPARRPWLPSIRVHHICLPDDDKHEHDHPWDARTIVLQGAYIEERKTAGKKIRGMLEGSTSRIKPGDFHRIAHLGYAGVFTLFFTWKHLEDWGFNVDGQKVLWREYLQARSSTAPLTTPPAPGERTVRVNVNGRPTPIKTDAEGEAAITHLIDQLDSSSKTP